MTGLEQRAELDAGTVSPAFEKTEEVVNCLVDSTRWNGFRFRDGDVVVGSWAKAGTSWLQQIVVQLIFKGAADVPALDLSPWVERQFLPMPGVMAMLEAQRHRRVLKTHLPVNALVYSPLAKYLYIGRDGRDVLWSWHNHHRSLTQTALEMINRMRRAGPPLEPATDDVRQYFHAWLDRDGFPLWPFWSHVQSWWNVRNHPAVMLVHFNELKRDLPGMIRRIARFLDIDIDESVFPAIVEHCGFAYMRARAAKLSVELDYGFIGGAKTFIYKGTNARWRDVLTAEDVEKYERCARENLSAECARWLATGERTD